MTILEFDIDKTLNTPIPILTYGDILDLQLEFDNPSCQCFDEINKITLQIFKKGESSVVDATVLLETSNFILIDKSTWSGSVLLMGDDMEEYIQGQQDTTAVMDGIFTFTMGNKTVTSQVFFIKMYRVSGEGHPKDYTTIEDVKLLINQHNIDLNAHENLFEEHNNDPNAHKLIIDNHNLDMDAHSELLKQYDKSEIVDEKIENHNLDITAHEERFKDFETKLDAARRLEAHNEADVAHTNLFSKYDESTVVDEKIKVHDENPDAHKDLIANLLTEEEVDNKLVNYATNDSLQASISAHNTDLNSHANILKDYVKESELTDLVTEQELADAIASIPSVDVDNKISTAITNHNNDSNAHPGLTDGLVTEQELADAIADIPIVDVDGKISTAITNHNNDLSSHPTLATKAELSNLVTETELTTAIENFVPENEVDSKIATAIAAIPPVDVDSKINTHNTSPTAHAALFADLVTTTDLSDAISPLATKTEIANLPTDDDLATAINTHNSASDAHVTLISPLATKVELNTHNTATDAHTNLISPLATKIELNTHNNDLNAHSDLIDELVNQTELATAISPLATKVELSTHNTATDAHANLISTLATKTEIANFIPESVIDQKIADATEGTTPVDVETRIQAHNTSPTAHAALFADLVDNTELSTAISNHNSSTTAHPTLATKAELTDLVTNTELSTAIADFIPETEIDSKIADAIADIPSVDVDSKINTHNTSPTAHADLFTDLVTTTELSSAITPLATKTEIADFIPETEIDAKLTNFVEQSDINASILGHNNDVNAHSGLFTDVVTNTILDTAIANFIPESEIDNKIADAIDTIPVVDVDGKINAHNISDTAHTTLIAPLATKVEIANFIPESEIIEKIAEHNTSATAHPLLATKTEIANFIPETEIDSKINDSVTAHNTSATAHSTLIAPLATKAEIANFIPETEIDSKIADAIADIPAVTPPIPKLIYKYFNISEISSGYIVLTLDDFPINYVFDLGSGNFLQTDYLNVLDAGTNTIEFKLYDTTDDLTTIYGGVFNPANPKQIAIRYTTVA